MQWKSIKQQILLFFERSGKFDPVALISEKLFLGSPVFAALMVAILTLGCEVWIGESSLNIDLPRDAICAMYPEAVCPVDIKIIHYNDPAELYFAGFLWGVFLPLVWWYYLSTPRMWNNLIALLSREEIVDDDKLQKILKPVLKNSFWLPSLGITIFILSLYIFGSIPSEIERERFTFWLLTRSGKFFLLFFLFIHTYVLIGFALKELILVLKLRGFFNQNEIKAIHVYHVDQCGGFGSIGTLTTQLTSLAVMIGVFAAWYSFLPVMSGGGFNFGTSTLVLYAAYVFLVPIFLITLTSPVTRAMKRHKQRLLMKVSRQLQAELDGIISDADSMGKGAPVRGENHDTHEDRYKRLKDLYEQLQKIPESPIRLLNLKRFTGFAIFPALFGFVTFLIDIFDLLNKIRERLGNL